MNINKKRLLALVVLVLLVSSLACATLTGGQSEENTRENTPIQNEAPVQNEPAEEASEPAVEEEEPTMEIIRQWAISAVASSEYSSPDWSASQAIGEPDTEECGDMPTAWASAESTGADWLELYYQSPVYPDQITVYETHAPNQVTMIEVLDTEGNYHTVFTADPEVLECPYTLTVDVPDADYLAVGLKLTVDQSIMELTSWNEIDAVELVGRSPGEGTVNLPEEADEPAEEANEPDSEEEETATDDYQLPDWSTSTLDSGTFYYEVTGADADKIVDAGYIQDQSTSTEYVIGLISQDSRYSLTLFLPHEMEPGMLNIQKYEWGSITKAPGSGIYIGVWFYEPEGGLIMIGSADNDVVTGSFVFTAVHQDDPTKMVTVSGIFKDIPLVNK